MLKLSNKNMKTKAITLLSLMVLLIVGCSSTSSGNLSGVAVPKGTFVTIQGSLNDQERLFLPDLVSVLEKRGFTVTKEDKSQYSVQITFSSSSSFNVYCNIVLMKEGIPVISANGTNPGWGVLIARGTAYRGVFDSALREFEKKLYGS